MDTANPWWNYTPTYNWKWSWEETVAKTKFITHTSPVDENGMATIYKHPVDEMCHQCWTPPEKVTLHGFAKNKTDCNNCAGRTKIIDQYGYEQDCLSCQKKK